MFFIHRVDVVSSTHLYQWLGDEEPRALVSTVRIKTVTDLQIVTGDR